MYNTDLSRVNSSTTNITKLFKCKENAVSSDGKSRNIEVNCTPKGSWAFGDLKCLCEKGFQLNEQGCLRK
jgi:hypothetical protein